MRIWQVTTNDHQIRFYWFQTRKEAEHAAREYKKDAPNIGEVDIQMVEFDASRRGIVEALNWVITLTCFNEG